VYRDGEQISFYRMEEIFLPKFPNQGIDDFSQSISSQCTLHKLFLLERESAVHRKLSLCITFSSENDK